MQYAPKIDPFFNRAGWIALALFALVALVIVPSLFVFVPEESPFHVSAYTVTLVGKIMCYCIVAVAMNLIWGYAGILSLGHGVFFALGGFESLLIRTQLGEHHHKKYCCGNNAPIHKRGAPRGIKPDRQNHNQQNSDIDYPPPTR